MRVCHYKTRLRGLRQVRALFISCSRACSAARLGGGNEACDAQGDESSRRSAVLGSSGPTRKRVPASSPAIVADGGETGGRSLGPWALGLGPWALAVETAATKTRSRPGIMHLSRGRPEVGLISRSVAKMGPPGPPSFWVVLIEPLAAGARCQDRNGLSAQAHQPVRREVSLPETTQRIEGEKPAYQVVDGRLSGVGQRALHRASDAERSKSDGRLVRGD